jgi:preprotein translocase subunit SecD
VRKYAWYLVLSVVIVLGALVATLVADNSPVLGLDLQGGISVVLAPVGKANSDSIDKAVDIIRNRVDSLGVAEPEISRQGENVIIDLPGVRDRDKARRLVGKTAELRFRKVDGCLPPAGKKESSKSSTTSTTAAQPGASTTTAPSTTTTTAPGEVPTTTLNQEKSDQPVVFAGRKGEPCGGAAAPRYSLGPTLLTGRAVSSAKATFEPASSGGQAGWGVNVSFHDIGAFNQKVAAPNVNQRVGIVLDGIVQSAPTIQAANFTDTVRISGSFSEGDAKDLALVLRFGALPVQLKEQTTNSVSPTLGKDQLRAGIAAGIIGLALVALYMLAYYRVLGVVVILGLGLSAAAIYALVSYLGNSIGLTLTLAGVTGLIVSVGITVDSYVVYFERLKDEVKTGKTVRSSVDRGFAKSFRTILAADLVSLIGAVVLYLLAIGSVRGFAFFLGLSTLLDLILSYFFMHPLVYFLARRASLVRGRRFGIAAGLDAGEVTA